MPRLLATVLLSLTALLAGPMPVQAQAPDPSDVNSPGAIVAAAYEAIERQPGEPFD